VSPARSARSSPACQRWPTQAVRRVHPGLAPLAPPAWRHGTVGGTAQLAARGGPPEARRVTPVAVTGFGGGACHDTGDGTRSAATDDRSWRGGTAGAVDRRPWRQLSGRPCSGGGGQECRHQPDPPPAPPGAMRRAGTACISRRRPRHGTTDSHRPNGRTPDFSQLTGRFPRQPGCARESGRRDGTPDCRHPASRGARQRRPCRGAATGRAATGCAAVPGCRHGGRRWSCRHRPCRHRLCRRAGVPPWWRRRSCRHTPGGLLAADAGPGVRGGTAHAVSPSCAAG
jgi:hypothetical protein